MLKLASLERKDDLLENMLCHPISVYKDNESKIILNEGTIINQNDVALLEDNFLYSNEFYLLVSTDNKIKQQALRDFTIEKIMEFFLEEKTILLNKFPLLPEKSIVEDINNFFKITLNSLKTNYLIDLITHPIILRKSIDMGILGVFFSFQLNLSIREMEDVLVTCLLSDLNLCNNFSFNTIASKEFNKENFSNYILMKNSSYELIKDDISISNNTKRLVKYWKSTTNSSTNNNGNSVIKTTDNMIIIKDITMEIVQLSNDLLSYDTDIKGLKNIYKYPIINSLENELFKGMEKIKKSEMFKNRLFKLFKKK